MLQQGSRGSCIPPSILRKERQLNGCGKINTTRCCEVILPEKNQGSSSNGITRDSWQAGMMMTEQREVGLGSSALANRTSAKKSNRWGSMHGEARQSAAGRRSAGGRLYAGGCRGLQKSGGRVLQCKPSAQRCPWGGCMYSSVQIDLEAVLRHWTCTPRQQCAASSRGGKSQAR